MTDLKPVPLSPASSSDPEPTAEWTRQYLAALARMTGGLSPAPMGRAWLGWWQELAADPARQLGLVHSAAEKNLQLAGFWMNALQGAATGRAVGPRSANSVDPAAVRRFEEAAWARWPFNVLAQSYLNLRTWWQEAADGAGGGTDPAQAELLRFAVRQTLEAVSPQNFLLTNPALLEQTAQENGENLRRGFEHWLEDARRAVEPGSAPEGAFRVGKEVAVTPGKVVFRNRLIELIQYGPATPDVYAEPVLIVPAWIMKYYILDLSPANSLVHYLVGQGHTVFMISWKNPDATDRELAMDDYVDLGVCDALDVIGAICPDRGIHATGYCIGGTLLAIAAALLATRDDRRLRSMTLLAAQTDFSEPGELSLFINPDQLAMLEATMAQSGVLDSRNMAGAFALLRARDLIWDPAVNTYLKGERAKSIDLMAWNADGTRMAHRMHTDYLYQLYLRNELARGTYRAGSETVDLAKIDVPMFVVGTEADHVAPWRSVYKVRGLVGSHDYTFLLTSGGHNAGIISGPVHPKRTHRLLSLDASAAPGWPTAEDFLARSTRAAGSWWPVWQQWLVAHSSKNRAPPPPMGAPDEGFGAIADAPGSYVHRR